MAGHECYHCKQFIAEGEPHDCWTTTPEALTRGLSEDLQDAWERIRETALEFGEQRVYASHHSIMFARKACYCFVRPKAKYLELCVFVGRPIKSARIKKPVAVSKTKFANLLRIVHRDEVEAPITDWMREAYDFAAPAPKAARVPVKRKKARAKKRALTGKRKTTRR